MRKAAPILASVIIPTFNRLPKLKQALTSLKAQRFPADEFEIIVVDDGSTDETHSWLVKASERLSNLRYESIPHSGPAVARNVASAAATGQTLIFLGDDIIASDQLVEKHVAAHRERPEGCAIQGGVKLASHIPQTRFVRYLSQKSAAQFRLRDAKSGDRLPFWALYTCNCSIPKRLLKECGGFPEQVVYYDDTFLGWQLEQRGIPIIYQPEALAYHDHAQSLNEYLKRQRQAGRDAAVLAASYPQLRNPLRVDQAKLLEGPLPQVAKKLIKRALFNGFTVPLLKKIADAPLVPFPLACLLFSGILGWAHRTAASSIESHRP